MYLKVPALTSMFLNSMGSGNPLSSMTTIIGSARLIGGGGVKSMTSLAIKGAVGEGKGGFSLMKRGFSKSSNQNESGSSLPPSNN